MSKKVISVSNRLLENINNGKRRKLNLLNWKDKAAQLDRNEGKPYEGKSGLLNPPRVPPRDNNCSLGCRKEGCNTINLNRKVALFQQFWSTGDYNAQTNILSRYIRKLSKADENIRQRQFYGYYLPDESGFQMAVCRKTFMEVFGVGKKRLEVIQRKVATGDLDFSDKRGSYENRKRFADNGLNLIQAHILSYESSCSHYCRNEGDPTRQYLLRDLSVSRMFRDFNQLHEESVDWEWAYRTCFAELKLKFALVKSDTCGSCDLFEAQIRNHTGSEAQLENLWFQKTEHHLLAENGYQCLREDTEKSKLDPSYVTICVDLQGILLCPRLTNSEYYYQRKYTCYNFAITNPSTDETTMAFWHQVEASRGSAEISSCLYRYLIEKYPVLNNGENRVLTVYSDRCVGQNNNFIVLVMFMLLIRQNRFTEIRQKFMTTGHSFLPCDRQFSLIEKKMMKATIHQPNDYIAVIQESRLNKPFVLQRMVREDFLDFMNLTNLVVRPRTLKVTQIMYARLTSENINLMETKTHLWNENWQYRPLQFNEQFGLAPIPPLYQFQLPISLPLQKDLKDMIPFLCPESQVFWTNFWANYRGNV